MFGPSCTEFVYPGCWHFDNGATSKNDNDNVLIMQDGTKCRSTVSHGGTVPHYSLVSWVNILPKNPYLFLAGFLGNSYFAEEQKG